MASQPFPKRAQAAIVELAAQFGDQFGREQMRELRDEQQTALRQQRAVLADSIGLIEKERAKLRMPGVIVGEEERRRNGVDAERARGVDERPDVIVVPGVVESDRGL